MGCSPSHERPLDCPGEFLSIGEATRGWRRLAAGCPLRAGDQVALVISTITDHESVRDPHVPSFRQAVSCWWVAGKTETYEKSLSLPPRKWCGTQTTGSTSNNFTWLSTTWPVVRWRGTMVGGSYESRWCKKEGIHSKWRRTGFVPFPSPRYTKITFG